MVAMIRLRFMVELYKKWSIFYLIIANLREYGASVLYVLKKICNYKNYKIKNHYKEVFNRFESRSSCFFSCLNTKSKENPFRSGATPPSSHPKTAHPAFASKAGKKVRRNSKNETITTHFAKSFATISRLPTTSSIRSSQAKEF